MSLNGHCKKIDDRRRCKDFGYQSQFKKVAKKSKLGVCDHFEPSVSIETWHKAVSSIIRSKLYATFLVEHSSEENLASKFTLISKI